MKVDLQTVRRIVQRQKEGTSGQQIRPHLCTATAEAFEPSPCAKLCHAHPVEMHNVFKISAALH